MRKVEERYGRFPHRLDPFGIIKRGHAPQPLLCIIHMSLHALGQKLIQLRFALDLHMIQRRHLIHQPHQQLVNIHVHMREHASDAVDIDPLFFSLCLHGIQEDISVILKEDDRRATKAPRLQQFVFCQGMAQRFLVQPGAKEGGVFPGAGRRVLKAAGCRFTQRDRTIQMMCMQTICADSGSAEFHDDHLCLNLTKKTSR